MLLVFDAPALKFPVIVSTLLSLFADLLTKRHLRRFYNERYLHLSPSPLTDQSSFVRTTVSRGFMMVLMVLMWNTEIPHCKRLLQQLRGASASPFTRRRSHRQNTSKYLKLIGAMGV